MAMTTFGLPTDLLSSNEGDKEESFRDFEPNGLLGSPVKAAHTLLGEDENMLDAESASFGEHPQTFPHPPTYNLKAEDAWQPNGLLGGPSTEITQDSA
jgi:hypothetical protein